MHKLFRQSWFFYLLALVSCWPTLVMILGGGWQSDPRFFNDGTAFYCAGQLATTTDLNPYGYDHLAACSEAHNRIPSNFVYPPPAVGLFALWSLLPYPMAIFTLFFGSISALGYVYRSVWSMYLEPLSERISQPALISLSLWLAMSQISFMNLPYGQVNILVAAGVLAFIQSWRQKKDIWAGSILALAVVCKFSFVIMGLLAFLRPRMRVLLSGAVVSVFFSVFALMLLGREHTLFWFQTVLPTVRYEGLGSILALDTFGKDNQSLYGFLVRHIDIAIAANMTRAICLILLFVAFCRLYRLRQTPDFLTYGAAVLPALAFLSSSMSWQAYHVYLLPLDFWLLRLCLDDKAVSRFVRRLAATLFASLLVGLELCHLVPALKTGMVTLSVISAVIFALGFPPTPKSAVIEAQAQ